MRKLLTLLFVASVFTFAACEKKADTAGTTEDTTAPAVDPAAPDTMAAPVDTAAVDTSAQ